jgi:hypothetical protein
MSSPTRVGSGPSVLGTTARLLTFRSSHDELMALDRRHLAFGLVLTWLAGIGRTWDDPRVAFARKLGFGSVAYVFVLATVLWLIVAPMRTPATSRVSYRTLLTFVTLTAPPAALYAIPVERWFSVETAIDVNLVLLAIVATWRVALLAFFLSRAVGLRAYALWVTTLAPLALVVSALTFTRLAEGAIVFMADLRKRRPDDGVNFALLQLTAISIFAALPLVIAYAWLAWHSWRLRAKTNND